ncbi:MAG: histidinol-phosphatase [Desulforhopalus sp.]
MHTSLCGHAVGTMEEYVQAGIDRGLQKIIFLEHMEEGIDSEYKTWLSDQDFDDYFNEGKRLQDLYRDRIAVGLGVECGYNPERREDLFARLQTRQWDQIGISCHFLKLRDGGMHLNLFSRREEYVKHAIQDGVDQLLERYFATLTEAVQYLPGTMLCHLDGGLRFVPELELTEGHYKQIELLLQSVRKKNMAIEVNSSGFDIRGEQFPNRRILAMAASYDIPLLFGSDAHNPKDVGRYFNDLSELLTPAPRP